MNFVPLHQHTHFSLLDGLSHPSKLAKRIKFLGYPAAAITDHGGVNCCIKWIDACQKHNIKPILGNEFYLCADHPEVKAKSNRKLAHLCVLAKNLSGWKDLIHATTASNRDLHFYYKPRLSLDCLAPFMRGNCIAFSGHPGSELANILFTQPGYAYRCKTREDVFEWLHADHKELAKNLAAKYRDIFGKENFFLEIQLIDQDKFPVAKVIAEVLREVGAELDIPCVATADSHYTTRQEAQDQRILLCSNLHCTLKEVESKIETDDDFGMKQFFISNSYHVPTIDELMSCGNYESELRTACQIGDMCEEYSLKKNPVLPKFDCPDGLSSAEYLRELCRRGWREKIDVNKINKDEYGNRVKYELSVINNIGLDDYFLIVQDYVNFARNQGWLVGPGRGCLTGDVPIVLQDGCVKQISDVNIGDMVINANGCANKVLNRFEYDVQSEPMIDVKCNFGHSVIGVKLTADHKVLVAKSDSEIRNIQDFAWLSAASLEQNDWVMIPRPKIIRATLKAVDFADFCDKEVTFYNRAEVVHLGKPLQPWNKWRIFSQHSRFLNLDARWIKLLGFWAGNGSIRSNGAPHVVFSFNADKPDIISEFESLLLGFGFAVHKHLHRQQKCVQIYVHSIFFYRWIKSIHDRYECKPNTKHVPQFIFNLSNELIQTYLDGYLLADGHRQKYGYVVKTVSKLLSQQIRFLHWVVGRPATLSEHMPNDKRNGFQNCKYSYHLHIPISQSKLSKYRSFDDFIALRVSSVNEITFTGKVYDLQIENQHNYLTTSFVVHNSGAGSMVCYLLDITRIDPIKYGLIFERFYNSGRNTGNKKNLPDLDLDFQVEKRPAVIDYIRRKYGETKVAQIATYGRLQGRSALKEVMRVKETLPFDEINRITTFIPDEAAIADELEEMSQSGEEKSIILWSLQHRSKELSEWCALNDDGTLSGDYAEDFAQAIRLEGTLKSQGKHAAGLVVAQDNLEDCTPMIYDKNSPNPIAGLEFGDLESMGSLKLDILGVALLDKVQMCQQLVNK